MKCDCGGTPRRVLKENHKRKRATKICDYNFQRYDRLKKDGLCHLTVENGGHKRPPTIDIAGNESAHRLNKKHMLILELTIKGGCPRKTLTALRLEDPDTLRHAITIYNGLVCIRKEHLKGKQPMEALLDELCQN